MKINILSPGRFHVLDLARELDKNGFDVKFYSYVPTKRARKFGLPSKCNVSFLWFLLPFLALTKITKFSAWSVTLRSWAQDIITLCFMRKCNVLISMSGCFPMTNKRAKHNGSIVIIERGSKHILEQKRILESIPSLTGTKPVPDINVKKELIDYELADYISVASLHVKESFLKHGFPEEKLFVNPYGVDLSMFRPIKDVKKEFDVIMVGAWSYQKGCDLLIEAIKRANVTLLHVGGLNDVPFPDDPHFIHIDKVDQSELSTYYNKARVFALCSRQEGLALVQAQAISCNLPIVGSPNSGAVDLKQFVEESDFINVPDPLTVENIVSAINLSLKQSEKLNTTLYAGDKINGLSWDGYGKRYTEFLNVIARG